MATSDVPQTKKYDFTTFNQELLEKLSQKDATELEKFIKPRYAFRDEAREAAIMANNLRTPIGEQIEEMLMSTLEQTILYIKKRLDMFRNTLRRECEVVFVQPGVFLTVPYVGYRALFKAMVDAGMGDFPIYIVHNRSGSAHIDSGWITVSNSLKCFTNNKFHDTPYQKIEQYHRLIDDVTLKSMTLSFREIDD